MKFSDGTVRWVWKRPPGWGWPKWRGWRVVMDNLLIPEGGLLPRGYGVAWRQLERDCVVVMPIPVNILAGWLRRLWHWIKHGVRPSAFDRAVIEAFQRGYTDGSNSRLAEFKRAEERVRQLAYEDGKRDLALALKEIVDP